MSVKESGEFRIPDPGYPTLGMPRGKFKKLLAVATLGCPRFLERRAR